MNTDDSHIKEVSQAVIDTAKRASEKLKEDPHAYPMDLIEWAGSCQALLLVLFFNGVGSDAEELEVFAEGIGELATLAPSSVKSLAFEAMSHMGGGIDGKHKAVLKSEPDHDHSEKESDSKTKVDKDFDSLYL